MFRACACGEYRSFPVSGVSLKHALVVNTQGFRSRERFKHALVMNTLPRETYAVVIFWRGQFAYAVAVSGAGRIIF